MARKDARAGKTNAMRELERAGVSYDVLRYEHVDAAAHGHDYATQVAAELGIDPASSFKTLLCVSPAGNYVVCCIPAAAELDLKRAAAAAQQKSLSLVSVASLEAATGYVRGGVSPVGMRKSYLTLIDQTATLFSAIYISGGKQGVSLRIAPDDLIVVLNAHYAELMREGSSE